MNQVSCSLYQGDCLELMNKVPNNSVNLILVDLPYGVTKNHWDHIIDPVLMWEHFRRILVPNGCIVLTATQPFASMLISSNLSMFRYDLIWSKTIASGQLNVKRQPLRTHEHILVFYSKPPTYNEQKTAGEPYRIVRKADYSNHNYGAQTASSKDNDGFRHAKSVVVVSNPRIKNGHPTQKPNDLLELLIKMYTNPQDIVMDCCMGSGSTGVAALNLERSFIGMEKDSVYFDMSIKNIEKTGVAIEVVD